MRDQGLHLTSANPLIVGLVSICVLTVSSAVFAQSKVEAFQLYRAEKYDEAAEVFGKLADQTPEDPQVWFLLGRSEMMRENCIAAERAFRRQLDLEPDSLEGKYYLALTLVELDSRAEAIALLKSIREAHPDAERQLDLLAASEEDLSPQISQQGADDSDNRWFAMSERFKQAGWLVPAVVIGVVLIVVLLVMIRWARRPAAVHARRQRSPAAPASGGLRGMPRAKQKLDRRPPGLPAPLAQEPKRRPTKPGTQAEATPTETGGPQPPERPPAREPERHRHPATRPGPPSSGQSQRPTVDQAPGGQRPARRLLRRPTARDTSGERRGAKRPSGRTTLGHAGAQPPSPSAAEGPEGPQPSSGPKRLGQPAQQPEEKTPSSQGGPQEAEGRAAPLPHENRSEDHSDGSTERRRKPGATTPLPSGGRRGEQTLARCSAPAASGPSGTDPSHQGRRLQERRRADAVHPTTPRSEAGRGPMAVTFLSLSPDESRLAFVIGPAESGRDEQIPGASWGIYLARSVGMGRRLLRRLLYGRSQHRFPARLGPGSGRLLSSGLCSYPAWSPDGKKLAFETTRYEPTDNAKRRLVVLTDLPRPVGTSDRIVYDDLASPAWVDDTTLIAVRRCSQLVRKGALHRFTYRDSLVHVILGEAPRPIAIPIPVPWFDYLRFDREQEVYSFFVHGLETGNVADEHQGRATWVPIERLGSWPDDLGGLGDWSSQQSQLKLGLRTFRGILIRCWPNSIKSAAVTEADLTEAAIYPFSDDWGVILRKPAAPGKVARRPTAAEESPRTIVHDAMLLQVSTAAGFVTASDLGLDTQAQPVDVDSERGPCTCICVSPGTGRVFYAKGNRLLLGQV